MLALLIAACAPTSVDTAKAIQYEPPDRPDEIVYVWAGTTADVEVGDGYAVELADPAQVVARVGDRLCTVTGDGRALDSDGDGLCELSPSVDLAISLWR